MSYFKLQIGCLFFVLYFIVVYIRGSYTNKIKCNRLFDALMYVAPWAIVFDGVTAWTVNHRDIVPDWLNLVLHGLFFFSMIAVIAIIYLYMAGQLDPVKSKKKTILRLIPSAISLVLVGAFLYELAYMPGNTTDYSMGLSVIIGYASLVIHCIMILVLIITKWSFVEKRKRISLLAFVIIQLLLLTCQCIWPEILVTALFPAIGILCLYINFEDPFIIKMKNYNEEVVTGFATIVENRDGSTGGHIRRTKGYVQLMLDEMQKVPEYRRILSKDYVTDVSNSAPMHDIGKISTPDIILKKPGRLTEEEYDVMKQHSADGSEIIQTLFAGFGDEEYRKIAHDVAKYHHEKWNGKGYPEGLSGENIPLAARIMAIADVFDAVSAKRCYRDAMPLETCFEIIEKGAGSDFDPDLVKVFINAKDRVTDLYNHSRFEDIDSF